MTEYQFLELWKENRLKYMNKPTHIPRLKTFDRRLFEEMIQDYNNDQIQEAIDGLFKQENKSIGSMFVTPTHFLENVTKYYNAELSKEYQLYGISPKKIEVVDHQTVGKLEKYG